MTVRHHVVAQEDGDSLPDPTGLPEGYAIVHDGLLMVVRSGVFEAVLPGPVSVWVPAASWAAQAAGPTLAGDGAMPGWALDAAATEGIVCTTEVPASWASFDVDLWWLNAGAGTGDVVFSFKHRISAAADLASDTAVDDGNVTEVAGAQDIIAVTTVASDIATAEDAIFNAQLQRLGADAADTLANDVAILGIRLRRVS